MVITFLPRSKCLLISWLQSPSAVILEPQKIKSETVSIVSPSIQDNSIGKSLTKLWKLAGKLLAGICLSKPKLKSPPAEKIRSEQICTTEPWDGPGMGTARYFRRGAEQT